MLRNSRDLPLWMTQRLFLCSLLFLSTSSSQLWDLSFVLGWAVSLANDIILQNLQEFGHLYFSLYNTLIIILYCTLHLFFFRTSIWYCSPSEKYVRTVHIYLHTRSFTIYTVSKPLELLPLTNCQKPFPTIISIHPDIIVYSFYGYLDFDKALISE